MIEMQLRRERAFTAVFDVLVDKHGWQRDGKVLEKTFENMAVAGGSGITARTITISRQRIIAEAHLGFDSIAMERVPEFAQDSHYASIADRLNGKVEDFVREQRV